VKPQRSHVISFPQITDTEGDEDEDEDGLEYDFRWHTDGFYLDLWVLGCCVYAVRRFCAYVGGHCIRENSVKRDLILR
jgi:hypothetical protein